MKTVLGLLLLAVTAVAQQHPQRLILKDGTFQRITQYEVKDGRVRYYSAERFEWEEVPADLVDWPATERYEKDRREGKLRPETQQALAEEEAERAAEAARSPEVAPGLRLPATGGVFLADVFQGEPQLIPLEQSGGEINRQMGKNILRAAINPLASVKQTIELAGARAAVQAHALRPTFYVNIEDSDGDAAVAVGGDSNKNELRYSPAEARLLTNRFRIVRAQRKKQSRVVANLKVTFYGKASQEQRQVPVTSESMGGGWTKVIPLEPLQPGEYALVEMLGENEINLYVWDFGVDPNAPQSTRAWKPVDAEAQTKDKEPALQERRKDKQ
ncbi:MAG TPA: hypothetical protein VNK82_05120 [Terriglobales bacterium]|nr:hypothetical protein [Terriglobales bacterium]